MSDVYITATGRRVLDRPQPSTTKPCRGYVSPLWPPPADPSLAHPESSRPAWARVADDDAFDDDTDEERPDDDSDDEPDEPASRDLLIDLAEWRRDRGVR